TDKATNSELVKHATVPIDTVTPVSAATRGHQLTNASPFTIPYSVSDQSPSSAIAKVELYVKGPLDAVYSLAAPADTSGNASGSFSYTPAGEGTYSFYTLATDKAGNAEIGRASCRERV